MNQVSWLIYLSNISGNIKVLLAFLGVIILIIAITYFYISVTLAGRISRWDDDKLVSLKSATKVRRFVPSLIVTAFLLWIVAALCPSQETVLGIAASQFGEELLKTKTANLAEQALNAWLNRQVSAIKKDSNDK